MTEPVDSMYPSDSEQVHYRRAGFIWQAHHKDGATIFIDASSIPKTALERIKKTFRAMELSALDGDFEWRRLPIAEVKKE